MESREPLVSVVIPTRNRLDKLNRCLASVYASDYPSIEVVVVDDASDADVRSPLKRDFPRARVLRNQRRLLLSYSRNLGAKHSSGTFIFFLDDDNVIDPHAISELVNGFEVSPRVAVVAPVIYYFEHPKVVWTSNIAKGRLPGFYVLGTTEPKDYVRTFSFHNSFMIKRTAFEECGRFDSVTFPIHFSELDLAYRVAKTGLIGIVSPKAKVWHDVGMVHTHVDKVRSYYQLRNRIILLKRNSTPSEYRNYLIEILPLLTAYYLVQQTRAAKEDRFRVGYNLIRGVVSGLAYRQPELRAALQEVVRPKEREQVAMMAKAPLVSVIVPTKNSAATLSRCLDSLVSQTYRNIEILVVDNFSTDGTLEIARTYPAVKVFQIGPERSAQVNFGVKQAKGTYVYRVDSDFVLEPTVIDEAVHECTVNGYKVLTIHNTSDPTISRWSAVRKLERDCYVDDDVNVAARFFDKSVFQTAGGFDESMVASEDYDLHNRLVQAGYKVGRITAKEVHVGEFKSLSEVVRKHVFYGRLIDKYIENNPESYRRQLSPIRIAYYRHWRDFLKDPALTAEFFLYQYVRYAAATAGYLETVL